jgi:ABC-type lipoprotein export system ATPase subunit
MSASNNNLYSANGINVTFQQGETTTHAVKDASIHIPVGSITIIYGPSGSGKSSMLNVLSGLQPPTSGIISYKNENLYSLSANELAYFRAHELGIVYQNNYWVKSLSVVDNIALPLYFSGFDITHAKQLALTALETVHMSSYASKKPYLLSGGEQQRVALARAIVNDPPVIIADEPTGNLDSSNGDMVIHLLKKLHATKGKTIILVTHNMEYLPIATHLLEIQDGVVTEIKGNNIARNISKIFTDTQHRISQFSKEDPK